MTPEIERYVLEYYVSKLTGKGIYVTYDRAMNIIDNSGYTKSKKVRLKKVIEAVAKKHGIAKVLEQIEKGMITDLGTLQTVKRYLKEIEKLGINPVTISARIECTKADNKEPERRQGFIREDIIQSCGYLIRLRRPDGRLSKTWCTDNG